MGIVYLARQAKPNRSVAIKVLREDHGTEVVSERLMREAQLLGQLSHPGIATVFEAGVADFGSGKQPWFAMEYVKGSTLTTHAENRSLDRRARVELIVAAARAVQHAHGAGIVHRDLKPENVVVRENGTPCVLDFGIARVASDTDNFPTLTQTGQVLGTFAYMAPEQARSGEVDERADQFALGAMLYELLSGELPLPVRGLLPLDAMRTVSDCVWTSPTLYDPSLAGDLEGILAASLASEANRRYPSVGEFADDLERWLAGKPVHARPPTNFEHFRKFARHNAVLVWSSALGLVLVGAVLAVALNATFGRARESSVGMLFSDRALLGNLQQRSTELWPTGSDRIPDLDRWVKSAQGLVQRLERHRNALEAIDEAGQAASTVVGNELGDDWLVGEGQKLIADLRVFASVDGLLAEMEQRLESARGIREQTIDNLKGAWSAAAERVRGDTRFTEELSPQEGLIPLGRDPESELEEFVVYGTGTVPTRDVTTGRIRPSEGDGIVLVLIPGGSYLIGTQSKDPKAPNYIEATEDIDRHEGPTFPVQLDTFLIGKFELTQDQWVRMEGSNPSDWETGSIIRGVTISALHPVESLSWQQAMKVLPRAGLTLPTEAQWEVAARAGSPWPRIEGPSYADLIGHVSWKTHDLLALPSDPPVSLDGFYSHMPIASLRPHSFGLHDVLGNVWELCRDVYKVNYHSLNHRAGDGLVLAEPDGDVSRRGGGCASLPQQIHIYMRQVKRFDGRDALTGVRVARTLKKSSDSRPTPPSSND